MKIIVFDFEVFRYDVLLGAYLVNENRYFQTWNTDDIKKFYYENQGAIWVGHNNSYYDNFILQGVLTDEDVYHISKSIIKRTGRYKLDIKLMYYDTMSRHFASLKVLEAYMGKNISETEVDFDISRKLTEKEKQLTEKYNRDDLDQTFENLKMVKNEFQLRLDLIKEFNLPIDALHFTEAQIAASALGAKKIENIENMSLEPVLYKNLKIKNQAVLDFYLKKSWIWLNGAHRKSIKIKLGGKTHTIAAGGIHAGELGHYDWAYYLDVSGYYNLVMINYNLLSRAIPDKGKKLYEYMYHEQLRLKKIDPVKRSVYKVILLAVFGAQSNKFCEFYDPYQGDLVRLTGEMFLVDLLEKLDGKVEIIQSNTDGIMLIPINNTTYEEIKNIVDEWQTRTKFTLKFEKIYNVIQRDVNNYMYKDDKGEIHVKGEAVKHWRCPVSPFENDSYNSKEPLIISKCIVEYYMNNKLPPDTIKENENDLRLFQFICKKGSYDSLELEIDNKIYPLQKVNRAFVGKKQTGIIYKRKGEKRDKYSNVPGGVFIWNEAINISLKENINYNYYIRRAYERIEEFRLKTEQISLF